MASSSSSSPSSSNMIMIPPTKYDVFLNFRGEDIRDGFTSHLYSALYRRQIQTFIDNQLIRGDEISPSLLNAIERSKISVVIFTEGYASSSWCLEELIKILECKNKYDQIVIPIFYHIDPSDVRNQTGIFGDSFSKLEERFQRRLDKLQEWRIALKEAANLSGFHSRVIRPESKLIEEIAKDILKRLNHMLESDDNDLVGAESCIKEIESLLSIGLNDVRTLGIWGIGGIGKTTIVEAIFKRISKHFESFYFARNVREAEENGGLQEMQGQLFCTLLEVGNVKTSNFNFKNKRFNCKKVLIIFDDVTRLKQVESLIGSLVMFAPGSRIIITTRNKQVLTNCRVNEIYEMKELVYSDALKLFSRYAFEQYLPDESFMELSKKIISYAHGVPLALKVFGCFLFEKSKEVWESAISKLKTIPNVEIQEVLKMCYDGLDDNEKNIFLDIVFFFVGKNRDFVIKLFDACGFFSETEMSVLVHKSLITISDNKIYVHNLLQDMGREIVRRESISDPGKRSRLCNDQDIYKVLSRNKGTDQIRGISLNMSEAKEIHLDLSTFTNMSNLRFLKFYGKENKCTIYHFQGSVFTELRYLRWDGYPLKLLPSNFHLENLVSLIMPHSNVEQLWDGVQNCGHLKHIDLSYSEQLTKLPDLSLATNLESLKLSWCTSLIEIFSSIPHLNKLVYLSLENCSSLKSFSEISCFNIEELYLSGTAIKELPSSIGCLSKLHTLELYDCKILESLPNSLCQLISLRFLNISGCSNLQRFPDELGNLKSLEVLHADETAIKELPSSIGCLSELYTLQLYYCKILGSLPRSLCKLKSLIVLDLSGCSNLQSLPKELGKLKSLRELYAERIAIREIPPSIIHLSKLYYLSINDCKRLHCLPELPCHISEMNARGCTSLEALSGLAVLFARRFLCLNIDLSNCLKLEPVKVSQMVKDAHPKISVMAIKLPEGGYFRWSYKIRFPGSEIPEWFNYKSKGSSIIVQPPPGWCSDKFVGFELCAITSFQDDYDINWALKVRCDHKRIIKGHDFNDAESHNSEVGTNIHAVRTNHLFLGLIVKKYLDRESCYDNEVFFEFYLEHRYSKQRENDAVKECGIYLLYGEEE